MAKKKKITDQQETAIQALFDNGFSDQRKALEVAKYSKGSMPSKIFGKPAVKAEIKLRQNSLARKHNIKQDDIIRELAKMSFYGVGDLIKVDKDGGATLDFKKLKAEHRAGIKSFSVREYTDGKGPDARQIKETKVEFISKISALESLSKHLGLFDKDNGQSSDLIEALLAARKRIRIQIDDDTNT